MTDKETRDDHDLHRADRFGLDGKPVATTPSPEPSRHTEGGGANAGETLPDLTWLSAEQDREFHQIVSANPCRTLYELCTIKAHAFTLFQDDPIDRKNIAAAIGACAFDAARAIASPLTQGAWQPIDTRPTDDSQFLACTADGQIMIFNGKILDMILRDDDRAPKHLQFPATHWMPLPTLPVQP